MAPTPIVSSVPAVAKGVAAVAKTDGAKQPWELWLAENWHVVAAVGVVALAAGGYAIYSLATSSSSSSSSSSTSASRQARAKGKRQQAKDDREKEKGKDDVSSPAAAAAAAVTAAEPRADSAVSGQEAAREVESETAAEVPVENLTPKERLEKAEAAKNKGNKYYTGGKFDAAIRCYTDAIQLCPPGNEAMSVYFCNRAACYANLNENDKVISDCTAALEIKPRYVKALNRRAQAYENKGELRSSLQDSTAACILDNFQDTKSMSLVERVLRTVGATYAAEEMKLKKNLLPSPSFITAFIESFNQGLDAFDEQTTLASVEEALAENLADGNSHYKRAILLMKVERYDEALQSLTKAIENQTSKMAEAYNWRGTLNFLAGNLSDAQEDYSKSLELAPNNISTIIKQAAIHTEKADFETTLTELDRALELDPAHPDLYYNRGQVMYLKGDYPGAIRDYKKAIELGHRSVFSHIQLAVTQYKLNNVKTSFETFKGALNLYPKSYEIHNYFGELLMDQKRFDEAMQEFDTAISLHPRNPLSFVNKAWLTLQSRQDMDAAIDLCRKAVAVDERCDLAYANLAQLYLQQGKIAEAIECYDGAKKWTRTEAELANAISCREAAAAQLYVMKTYNVTPPLLPGGPMMYA